MWRYEEAPVWRLAYPTGRVRIIQIPNPKTQIPSPKTGDLGIEAWDLGFWNLGFGIFLADWFAVGRKQFDGRNIELPQLRLDLGAIADGHDDQSVGNQILLRDRERLILGHRPHL